MEVDGAQRAAEGIKGYTKYLETVWGKLAGIPFLFPLSNLFCEIIPVYCDKAFHAFGASIVSTYIIYLIYSSRVEIAYASIKSKQVLSIQVKSSVMFILGAFTLSNYLILIDGFSNTPDIGYRIRALFEYSLIFGFCTASFTLLAMLEYMRANPKYILEYVTNEAMIEGISEMTQDTKRNMAQRLLDIMKEEELDEPEE